MDGCGPWRTIWSVFMPLLWPALVSTTLLAFIHAWNEFLFALTFVVKDTERTVPVGISLISGATAVTVNDYESSLLCERTGWTEEGIAGQVEALIVTRGAEGSDVWTRDGRERVTPCPITRAVDPTGCGDAYRAGLLHGRSLGWDWVRCARLGSVLGAVKIESQGPQNHTIDRQEIARRFEGAYGSRPW